MSKVKESAYIYQICPYCKSKKVKAKVVKNTFDTSTGMEATGYLCNNCKRYHTFDDVTYKLDRAEVKRDIKILQGMLIGD
jgi:hypothetical protein